MLAVREPVRQEKLVQGAKLSVGESLRFLARRRRVLLPLYVGYACVSAGFYSTIAWGAVSIARHYGINIVQVTGLLGPANIAAGLLGPALAGMLVDRIMVRHGAAYRLRLLAMMPVLAIPAMACALMPTVSTGTLCVATMMGVYPAFSTVFFSTLQGSLPNELRGFSISLCGLTNAMIGATGGPLLLAILSEHVFAGPAATANALSATLAISMFLGAVFFALALPHGAQQADHDAAALVIKTTSTLRAGNDQRIAP
jgi:MFS family permease